MTPTLAEVKEGDVAYVLISKAEYNGAIRSMATIDILSDILDRAPESEIPKMMRIVLGKAEITKGGKK